MIKSVITVLCIALVSMTAYAISNTNFTSVVKPEKQVHLDWCLDHAIDNQTYCPSAIGYYPNKVTTIILYVNKYLPNSNTRSDPIYLQCNNKPAVVNAGKSYTCAIRSGQGITWRVPAEYRENGVNGTLFWAEGATAE